MYNTNIIDTNELPTILLASKGLKCKHLPVWLHRQAGRYLPEFREIRKEIDFFTVCQTPEIACEVTIQPQKRYPLLDAAIIFSDILVIPQALDMEIIMKEELGPTFTNPIRTAEDIQRILSIPNDSIRERLSYVYEAIKCTCKKINVPQIGFCGGPWTLFAYMVRGGGIGKKDTMKERQESILNQITQEAELCHKLQQKQTDQCIIHLCEQGLAGAQLLQVFESNGGDLDCIHFRIFILPYAAQIPKRVKEFLSKYKHMECIVKKRKLLDGTYIDDTTIPITYFPHQVYHSYQYMAATYYDILSLDTLVDPKEVQEAIKKPIIYDAIKDFTRDRFVSITLQGNFPPNYLFAPINSIPNLCKSMVERFKGSSHIVNLGHGMLPQHDPEKVKVFIDTVRSVGVSTDDISAVDVSTDDMSAVNVSTDDVCC